jgi:hypothetical protein
MRPGGPRSTRSLSPPRTAHSVVTGGGRRDPGNQRREAIHPKRRRAEDQGESRPWGRYLRLLRHLTEALDGVPRLPRYPAEGLRKGIRARSGTPPRPSERYLRMLRYPRFARGEVPTCSGTPPEDLASQLLALMALEPAHRLGRKRSTSLFQDVWLLDPARVFLSLLHAGGELETSPLRMFEELGAVGEKLIETTRRKGCQQPDRLLGEVALCMRHTARYEDRSTGWQHESPNP